MRSIMLCQLAGLLLFLLLSSGGQAEIYRCIDANGQPKYQDNPCTEGEQTKLLDLHLGKQPTAVQSDQVPAVQGDQNRVQNAHFDQDLQFWTARRDTQAFHWIGQDGHTKQGAVSVQSTPPENPKKRIIYEVALSQCVKLDRGRRYRFAASFKAMGAYPSRHANRVNLIWYQSEDCTTRGQFAEYLEPDPKIVGWQRITRENRLRSLNAKAALITIVQSRIGANRQPAYWDDIELTPTEFESSVRNVPLANPRYTLPVGQNYLTNGEFQYNLDGWRYSGDSKWVAQVGATEPGAARLAIFSKKGGYGAHSISQCVNIGSNKVFAAGAKVMVDPVSTQKGGGIFRLSWYAGENCRGRSQAGFKEDRVKPVAGWQTLTIDRIEAPPGAQSANIYITRGVNDTGLFAYFFDDVYFKALAQ
jgi:hypothetical protein